MNPTPKDLATRLNQLANRLDNYEGPNEWDTDAIRTATKTLAPLTVYRGGEILGHIPAQPPTIESLESGSLSDARARAASFVGSGEPLDYPKELRYLTGSGNDDLARIAAAETVKAARLPEAEAGVIYEWLRQGGRLSAEAVMHLAGSSPTVPDELGALTLHVVDLLDVGERMAEHLVEAGSFDDRTEGAVLRNRWRAVSGQANKTLEGAPVRRCRVCGCTDADCRQCIARTGQPCRWVESDLCSACDEEAGFPMGRDRRIGIDDVPGIDDIGAELLGGPVMLEDDVDWASERPAFWHNVPGHTLLWALRRWPALATWLHDRTDPTVPR